MADPHVPGPVLPSDEELDREILEFLGKGKQKRRSSPWLRLVVLPLQVFALAVLPFWALIRGAVFAYHYWTLNGWVALVAGMFGATFILTVYGAAISQKFTGKLRLRAVGVRVVIPVVASFCVYSLIFLSSTNAKTEEVRSYYRTVHPLLRIASSTIILLDREVMITGLGRTRADYAAMGLPARESSLHYAQDDGFVHAMDLRTGGRGAMKNSFTEWYFRAMGFSTLRHVGTADHLHVSLRLAR